MDCTTIKKRGRLWTKTRPSMLVFGQCAVASLHTLQHLEEKKKEKMVENAFVTDQCTKFIFALLLCWFYLIRTQAFSVFSEVSCGSAASETEQYTKCQSQKQQLCEQRRQPVDDLVFIPHCYLFFLLLSQLPSAFTSSISLPYFLYLIFSCSSPHPLSQREEQCIHVSVTSFQCSHFVCCPTLIKALRHQCTAAALYLHSV